MHPPTIVKQPNGFYTCTYKNGPPHEGPGAGLEDMFEFFAKEDLKKDLKKKLRKKIEDARRRRS